MKGWISNPNGFKYKQLQAALYAMADDFSANDIRDYVNGGILIEGEEGQRRVKQRPHSFSTSAIAKWLKMRDDVIETSRVNKAKIYRRIKNE